MHDVTKAMDELVRIYRHDFLNVLQVVGGLSQLNKTERLMAYIRKASEEVQQFGRFIGCGDPRLALLIYEKLLQDLAGNYLLHVNGVMPLLHDDALKGLEDVLGVVQARLLHIGEGTVTVTVSGKEVPMLTVRILSENDLPGFWDAVMSAASESGLRAFLNSDKSELSLHLDNEGTAGEQ